ncbi:hypothetical protein [Allochromatium tepidum]|uniref:Uncharacterized protein n=1 Tax=Allochromatium tepidum TaxID=553982 RepID=A0ABM7QHX1_9GAMM|nr:hypothetical protein [Allochromatium tepidum]BCU05339.1 hypothetical protein Atep_00160 [Allochromatium tepidum]
MGQAAGDGIRLNPVRRSPVIEVRVGPHPRCALTADSTPATLKSGILSHLLPAIVGARRLMLPVGDTATEIGEVVQRALKGQFKARVTQRTTALQVLYILMLGTPRCAVAHRESGPERAFIGRRRRNVTERPMMASSELTRRIPT